ncbi:MAG: Ig-like domain-containing protein [Phycisphaerae bacterium]|nr:Ig-like domain-containing protein [Phycisphaerae bacterium]
MHHWNRHPHRWLLGVVLVSVVSGAGLPVLADDGLGLDPCAVEGFQKDGICGHAQAAIARFERQQKLALAGLAEVQTDTDITHVFLDLELKPTQYQLIGTATLTVTSQSDGLSEFTLDLRSGMTVDVVSLNGTVASFTRPADQILIALDRPYASGEQFQVAVTYHGTPDTDGFGAFGFDSHGSPSTPVVWTLSEPYYASTWWPCKEAHVNIDDKFTLDMWVTVPSNLTVASNGLLQGTDTLDGSRKRYRWHEGYPINVYLVSMTATNYTTWTQTYSYEGGSMPIILYAYPESAASVQSQTASVYQMVAVFSSAYGQYPFVNEKYGICQFPWGGGMEHQTITSQGAFAEWLNAHELSHQWWGDAVTCKTWYDIWLNEGLATFSEALWFERKSGGSFAAYKNRMNERRPSSSSWGGTVYCYDISSVGNIFNTNLSYNKGAWVVHMLRHVVGDAAFFDGLAAYRAAYEGGSATTEDFRAVFEKVSGKELGWFFDEWIYKGGAPYYRYGWQQVQIGAQRWLRLLVQQYQTNYPLFKMPIDITVTTSLSARTYSVTQWGTSQWYLLPLDGPVTKVEFDKDVWILRGAGTNTAYQYGPPKLIGVTPAPGSIVPLAPTVGSVQLQFSEPISYSAEAFAIRDEADILLSLTPSYDASSYTVALSLAQPLEAGHTWTVTVADSVRSQAGSLALDGEVGVPPALPSGDGLAGGGASISFYTAMAPDFDLDGDVDGEDLSGVLAPCFTGPDLGPVSEDCKVADLDDDGDVDMSDFGLFQRCFSGPGAHPDPACL